MRDHHDRHARGIQLANQLHHLALLAIIQPGRRLVEDEQPRAQREDARDGEPLPLPLAEQKRIGSALVVEPDRMKNLGAARLDFSFVVPEVARTKFHFGLNRIGENLMVGILEDVADLARSLGGPQRGAIAPFQRDGSGIGREQTDRHLRQRGFTRAVLADDRHELAARDCQRNFVEHARPVRIGEAYRLGCEQCAGLRNGVVLNLRTVRERLPRERLSDARFRIFKTRRMMLEAKQLRHTVQPRCIDAAFLEQLDLRHHNGWGSVREYLAFPQDHHPIALPQLFGLMLDDDEAGALLTHFADQREDLRAPFRIEVGSRLVEYDDTGAQREHRCDREALLLPARKSGGIAILEAAQTDRLERGSEARVDFLARHRNAFHREGDFMRHRGGEKLRFEILKDHPNLTGEVTYSRVRDRFAVKHHRAAQLAAFKLRNDFV